MKHLTINETTYSIFFRYLSKFGKQPHFRKHAPFQAVTICTVQSDGGKFTAQDVAICSLSVAPKPTPAMREVLKQLKTAVELLEGRIAGQPGIMREAIARAEAEQHADQYSRREGRLRSLAKVLDRCGRLRKIKLEFLIEYTKLDPELVPRATIPMSDERKEELMAAGQAGKIERRFKRKAERIRRQLRVAGQ